MAALLNDNVFSEVYAEFIEAPINTVACLGDEVILRSKTEPGIQGVIWTASPNGIDIFDGYSKHGKYPQYNISKNAGKVDLIFTASNDTALTYTVTEIGAENKQQSAEVIVMGKN